MKSKRINKIAIVLGACCSAALLGGILLRNTNVAEAASKDPLTEFSMEAGAGVRFVNQATPDGTINGLRYIISMPKGSYTQLMESSTYEDVSFGVLIAPESYLTAGHELTEENVFSENAIYDWAVWTDNGWVYDTNSDKVRIMNFESETLPIESEDGKTVHYTGSIVNILESNLTREFRGVGYVKYTQNGVEKYYLTDGEENVRSMTYVAQCAIADPNSTLGDTAKTWLQKNYVDKVTNQAASYKVEHYVQQKNGSYLLKEWNEVSENITIDDAVSAEPKAYLGYELDIEESVINGKVLANDKLVLKCYYTLKEADRTVSLGLIDKNEIGSIDLADYADYTARSLWTYAGVEADVDLSGDALATAQLNGAYVARFANENETVEVVFDVYDAAGAMQWNTVVADAAQISTPADSGLKNTKVSVAGNDSVPAGAQAANYYLVETKGAEAFDFRFLPLHSKEYYEQYYGAGISLSFNYYVSASQGAAATAAIKTTFVGVADNEYWTEINVNEWYTVSLSLDTLVDEWNAITLEVSGVYCRAEGGIVGGDNACTLAQWYIGGFKLSQDLSSIPTIEGKEKLVDKKDIIDYSFENLLLSKAEREQLAVYAGLGDITWTVNGVATAGATNIEGLVTVQAILTSGDQSCVLYNGKADFYNSDDGMVWMKNDAMPLENLVAKSNDSYTLTTSVVTDGYPANAAADTYYRVETAANKSMYTYSVTAMHSKAYYEMWQRESSLLGKSWSLEFDFTYTTTAYPDTYGANYYYFRVDGSNTHYYQGEWKTVSITLDRLLYSWDVYASKTANNVYGSEGPCVMVGTDENLYYGIDLVSYVGNFRSKMTAMTFDESDLKMVDLDTYKDGGVVDCDFANELTAQEKATIADYVANGYTVSWAINGNTDLDWNTVEGICTIAALAKKNGSQTVILVAVADIYDSSKDVVWQKNSGLSEDNLKVKQSGSAAITTSVVSENLPTGATADEYFYVNVEGVKNNYVALSITALHSKAYYEAMLLKYQLLGKTVNIKYDFTHTSTLSANYIAFYVNGSNNQYYEDVWNTTSITLDKMLENWNVYVGNSYNYYSSSPYNMFGADDAAYYGCGWELWVGNFRMEVSSLAVDAANLKLVDLNTYKGGDGTVNCDFANELTTQEKATIADYVANGYTVSWAVNGNTNPNWNMVEGICTIAAVAKKGSEQKVILIAQADIYDSTDGMVWQRKTGLSVDSVAMKSKGLTAEIATSVPSGAAEGSEYYRVYGSDTKGYYTVSVAALHSKAYYQMWQDKATAEGKTLTLKFDFWFNSECYAQLSSGWGYYITMVTGHSNKQFLEKQWQTVSIKLETLLNNFEKYADPAWNDWSSWAHMFSWQDGMATGNHTQETVDVETYIGNFRVTETANA